jgi:glycerophosphoryl diester phosphodiesterase
MKRRRLELPGRAKPYVMAHRGSSAIAPENTLASFRRAIADGADILETDLHLTRDGTFVCIHDGTLDRTAGVPGVVAEMTLAELKQVPIPCGRLEPQFLAERVPTLAELAEILPAHVSIALELKTDRFLEPSVASELSRSLAQWGVADRTVVISFHLERVLAVKRADPDLPGGFITANRWAPNVPVELIGPYWPLLIANPFYTWWAHRRGMLVAPLDAASDRRLWLYRLLGCDAILTDDPAATRRLLGR